MTQMTAQDSQQLLQLSQSLNEAVGKLVQGREAPNDASVNLKTLEETALEQAARIQQLLISPGALLSQQAINAQHLACLRWLCHFNIPKLVPVSGGPVAFESIAKEVGVPFHQLRSVSRMAMTLGFFTEPEPNKLGHSRISRAFAEDSSLIDWAIVAAEGTALYASKLVEATEKFGETQDKTHTAFNIATNTEKPFFDYLGTEPALAKQFASYMKNITNSPATNIQHVVAGFDWSSLPDGATVVDVGGSSGHASIAVGKEHKGLKFVVQDLLETLKTSATDTSALPADLGQRLSFMGHDFFTEQPVKDAAAYFMRTIIHDWPFAEACKIISHIADAMGPDSKLLIMDIVLPPPGTAALLEEQLARTRDLTMIETFNAKEREMQDWEELVAAVGKGLKVKNVVKPNGSSLSVLEVVRETSNGVNGSSTNGVH